MRRILLLSLLGLGLGGCKSAPGDSVTIVGYNHKNRIIKTRIPVPEYAANFRSAMIDAGESVAAATAGYRWPKNLDWQLDMVTLGIGVEDSAHIIFLAKLGSSSHFKLYFAKSNSTGGRHE